MIPPLIIQELTRKQINLVAITDHNSTANIAAVQKAAEGINITILPGMELQTKEEVHVLCIFDEIDQAYKLQKFVDQKLPPIDNRPEFFGEQFIVDYTGEFIRREHRMLLNSISASFTEVSKIVRSIGGLFIPAHVNRNIYGLFANLGFVPPDCDVDALEISRHLDIKKAVDRFPQARGYPLIQNGDVHVLDDFFGWTTFFLERPTIAEIRMALKTKEGRFFHIDTQ